MFVRKIFSPVFFFFVLLVFCFGFAPKALASFSACACSCFTEDSIRTTIVAPPTSASVTCMDMCVAESTAPEGSVSETPSNAYLRTTVLPDKTSQQRCVCEYPYREKSEVLKKLQSTGSDCTATCASACGGVANVDPDFDATKAKKSVQCIENYDCAAGDFKGFEDVECKYTETTEAGWPNGVMPHCSVLVTQWNADLECQKFGGIAKGVGSKCVSVSLGVDFASSYISRPYIVKASGVYAVHEFSKTDSVGSVENQGEALEKNANFIQGLCYTYGKNLGADASYLDISGAITSVVNGQDIPDTSRRYACVKSRPQMCGAVTPPQGSTQNPVIKTRTSYSCMPASSVTDQAKNCFSASSLSGTGYELGDLCSTGSLCCASSGTCTEDYECGDYKMCKDGKCVSDPICDYQNSDRRCRSVGNEAERNDSEICSPESVLSMANSRCPVSGQFCCKPVDSDALSSCAEDMKETDAFVAKFGKDAWKMYRCIDTREIPSSEISPTSGSPIHWMNGGNCLPDTISAGGAGNTAYSRCSGTGRTCCHVTPEEKTALDNRPKVGAFCATGMECKSVSSITTGLGSTPGEQFYSELSTYGACKITPISSENYLNNKECSPGLVCCLENVLFFRCASDDDCSSPHVCHPSLRICVPSSLVAPPISTGVCAGLAQGQGEQINPILVSSGSSADQFNCTRVADNNANASQFCLASNVCPGDAGSGYSMKCCAPGIGETSSVASTASTEDATVVSAGSFLNLPPCIQSGACTIDDIVWAGTQFANFLIALSGSVFLAIFVYAGFLYLKAGTSDGATKAKKMLVEASTGIFLMFAGFLLINFVQSSFISNAVGSKDGDKECNAMPNMQCTSLSVEPTDTSALNAEIDKLGCVKGKCAGTANRVCCPIGE